MSKDKFHEVSYEELSRFPEETLKNVSKFLGLDWSDQGIAAAIEANCAESMRDRGTPIPLYGEIATRSGNVSLAEPVLADGEKIFRSGTSSEFGVLFGNPVTRRVTGGACLIGFET